MCFAYLPSLNDCLAVSHVSRFWRASALGFPALWAKIPLAGFMNGGSVELVKLLLHLSRQCPVDIGRFDYHPTARAIGAALTAHIHHIRSIAWSCPFDTACLSLPAPMLENISSEVPGETFLQPTFLGGLQGRLRVLNLCSPILPSRCPALSTVTELSNLTPLFSLFPRLVVLSVVKLRRRHANKLPRSAVPRQLKRLTLSGSCDVILTLPRFLAPETRSVNLTMPASFLDAILVDLEQATLLLLGEPPRSRGIILTALSSHGRSLMVEFPYAASRAATSYERICTYLARQAHSRVIKLAVPFNALWLLMPAGAGARLGSLTSICASLCDTNGVFPWQQLESLSLLPASVSSVVFYVVYNRKTQPHVLDVSTFLMHFASNSGDRDIQYVVRGFPAVIVDAADKHGRERARLNVVFQDTWSDSSTPPPYMPVPGP